MTEPRAVQVPPNSKELKIVPGHVYVIKGIKAKGGYYVKIGQTGIDPKTRFKIIQNNVPFKTELYAQFWTKDRLNLEQDFFNMLYQWRVNGEWFILPERALKELCESQSKFHPKESSHD